MRHVEEGTGGVALDSHVLGTCEASKRDERAGLCDLCFVVIYTWLNVRLSIQNSRQSAFTHHALQDLLHSRRHCIGPLRLG